MDRPFAVRCAIGVTLGILAGFATRQPLFAVSCGTGALCTGFASLQGVYWTRAATMIAVAFAMAISTFVGTMAAHSTIVEIASLALWGAGYGLIASLGPPASAVGVNATIALVIFSNYPLPMTQSAECAALVIFGGLIQTALLVFSWPVQRYPEERTALANAFSSLASYARSIDCVNPTLPPASSLADVAATLSDPRPFGRRVAFAAFQTLLDEAERIRSTLGRIAATYCTSFLPQRDTTARALTAIATALQSGRPPSDEQLRANIEIESPDEQVRALFGQLRAIWRNVSIPLRSRSLGHPSIPNADWFDLAESLAILHSNLSVDAPFGRHAVRLAVTLAVTGTLAHVLPIQRGYWMTLTAAIVLRPDFTTTLSRGFARILGTLIGVAVATALVLALPDTPHVLLALAIFFAAIGYWTFQLNYGLYTVTVTAYVVFILGLVGTPEHAAVVSRAVSTLIGGAIAMFSYVIWPTWEAPHTRKRLLDLLAADRAYTRILFAGLIDPTSRDNAKLHDERAQVWSTRAKADESLERMLSEPKANDDIPRETALGIMAGTQRLGLANLTLATVYESPQTPALAELAPFAVQVETAFAAIDALLRGERAVPSVHLRDAYVRLQEELQWPERDALLTTLDIMVDAVNTMRDLASGPMT
ncbi:MAG: FUSC family protein [Candidatus Eremiobacteraeota bacterium]|nr:FUSC family protein [Candidatus Eremiobacteraeota bacterium]